MEPETITESTRWKIITGKDNFLRLKNDKSFWIILALGRALNALFFSHQALVAHEGDDSPAAVRARFNSVLFSCSILVESSPLVRASGKHFSHLPEFKKLSNLVNGKEARKIRESALARLRNKLVFHFNPAEIGRQLSRLDFSEATFLSAMGKTNAQTYYEMSDLCAFGTLYGAAYPSSDTLVAAATEVTEAVSRLIVDFSNVAQEFIAAALEVQGWYGEISADVNRKTPVPDGPTLMTRPTTTAISPSFIVNNVEQTIAFYRDMLGFETRFQQPDRDPFFAIIGRDGAQIFIKSEKDVTPVPNSKRHRHLRLDAFVYAPDPDALAAEFANHGAAFSVPLKDTNDGLRGFEICDPDGYVLFFGRPR